MARSFNGTTDGISIPINLSSDNKITVSFWLFGNGAFAVNALACEYSVSFAANPGAFFINLSGSGGAFFIGVNTTGTPAQWSTPAISAGVWYNIIFEIDITQTVAANIVPAVYYNGVSQTISGGSNLTAATFGNFNLFLMSRNVSSNFAKGYMADFAIWNTLLSSSDASNIFNGVRPVSVQKANLIGWWPLDGYASPEPDLSGNGNNGTLTGTSQIIGPPQLWRLSA